MTSFYLAPKSICYGFVTAAIVAAFVVAAQPTPAQDQPGTADSLEKTLLAGPAQTKADKLSLPSLDELLARAMEHYPDLIAAKAKVTLAESEMKKVQIEASRKILLLCNQLKMYDKQSSDLKTKLAEEKSKLEKQPDQIDVGQVRAIIRETQDNLVSTAESRESVESDLRMLTSKTFRSGASQPAASVAHQIPQGQLVETLKDELDKPTTLEFADNPQPLSAALEYVQEKHGIPIYLHTGSALDPTTSLLSISLKHIPLRYAFEAIEDLFDGKIQFVVRDYGILVVSKEDAVKNGYVSAVTFGVEERTAKPSSIDSTLLKPTPAKPAGGAGLK